MKIFRLILAVAVAALKLESANGKRDRLRAYAAAIQGYEVAMLAMRAGLRELQVETRLSEERYETRRQLVAQLLGTLQLMGRTPKELNILHPGGVVGAARANTIVAQMIDKAKSETAALQLDFEQVATLTALQETTLEELKGARQVVASARANVHAALETSSELPAAVLQENAKIASIVAASRNLEDFARAFLDRRGQTAPKEQLFVEPQLGTLPWPVAGRLLRKFGERDAAGVARPGIIIAAPALSIVRAPSAAWVKYQGTFMGLGQVVILEPQPSYLMIFSGLGRAYVRTGEQVQKGDALGLLGGAEPTNEVFLISLDAPDGAFLEESLYIETRKDGIATNPRAWFEAPNVTER